MVPEGEALFSNLPAVENVPLAVLTGDEDVANRGDDGRVPVAEFNSSV